MSTFTQENALAEESVGFMDRLRELRLPWIPVIVITVLVILAAFAPLLSPHDPRDQNLRDARTPPFQTWDYPLGTDFVGKDILSRLIYGARTSAFISMFALGAGVVVGTVLGLISGYAGRWVDTIIMRIADATMGFPSILLAMIIVAILGTGLMPIVVAVAVSTWPRIARMIRGEVLSVKDADFVILARIAGVSPAVIIWRHVFPNVLNTLMVITSLSVAGVILTEASLSFLGLGLPPGDPAWGIMVSEGRQSLLRMWWISLFPGVVITVVVMAFNFFGDWLRDTLDPKLRRV
ncbi:MAG: ABC transporter permease [Dehalococcoidia bacterium]|nr:ABC transporter permease [Dehalococcoidia bacterium]MYA62331.1 ABC transporter permease [Dehalococcoidia bacterium]MYH12400.1 ABC transporter permease [Rhodothermaceae bacterium]